MKIGVQKMRPGRTRRERNMVWKQRMRRREYKCRGLRYLKVRIRSSFRFSTVRESWYAYLSMRFRVWGNFKITSKEVDRIGTFFVHLNVLWYLRISLLI